MPKARDRMSDVLTRIASQGVESGLPMEERLVQLSWQRCIEEHSLDPARRPDVPHLTRSQLKEQQSSLGHEVGVIRDEIVRMKGMVGGAGYSVSMANAAGVIIIEDPVDDMQFYCASDRLGSMWAEGSSGTNGIGTCLAEGNPVAIYHDDHFFQNFSEQACAAVPLYGVGDRLLGVLNLSTRNPGLDKSTHKLAMNIAVASAELVDERIFREAHREHFVVAVTGVGTGSKSVLVAVDEDGRILGANRSARAAFSLSDSAIGSRSLWGIVERTTKLTSIRDLCRGAVDTRALTTGRSLAMSAVPPRAHAPAGGFGRPQRSTSKLRREPAGRQPLDLCAGSDRAMGRQVGVIRRILGANLPILLLGETGVGKDTLARAIHEESARAAGAYVAFNCAAIPETLIDSELFGYGGGAFTGAKKEGSQGRLVEASGGTLFLDEIGDMPITQQTRLLRVLESGEVMPLGGGKTRKVDLQIIAATHQNIEDKIAAGLFRQDLYYRLAGAIVRVPSLRERDDIEDIFHAILGEVSNERLEVSREAVTIVRSHRWPGNIRELKYVAQRAVRLCGDGVIRPDDLMLDPGTTSFDGRPSFKPEPPSAPLVRDMDSTRSIPATNAKRVAATAERDAILHAMSARQSDMEGCARLLGMSRATLYRKLKVYGLRAGAR